uniref:Luc7-like protein 3 n=1 Tax=Cacopsylla melanoneura TaxID=428564 RepID=A0A8D9F7M3_9HEMI
MAKNAASALLDELMGRHRNAAPHEQKKDVEWEDPEFCKFFLVKFCPHDLFVNTRADLGPCPKVHDDEAKVQFDKSRSYVKSQYTDEFIKFCNNLIHDVERKIVKGRHRLSLIGQKTEPPSRLSTAQQSKNEETIDILNEKINNLVKEAERVGMEGAVEKAQGLMKLCDQLKEERESLRRQNSDNHWSQTAELAAAQEKQMEVCTVCGAFLIVGDAQSRIDDHLMGKQHLGYSKLKGAVEELTTSRAQERGVFRMNGGRGSADIAGRSDKERSSSRVKESKGRERDRDSERRKRHHEERERERQH